MTKKKTNQKAARLAQPTAAKPIRRTGLPGVDTTHERPCWRFSHVDHEGLWGFDNVDSKTLCHILRKLRDFESMTLAQIFYSGGEPGKEYDVWAIPSPDAKARLDAIQLADMTKIHRLRLTGTERLYGFLDGNVFHVVWWDPRHEVWPSQLRNT
jgi:hypothetical protein